MSTATESTTNRTGRFCLYCHAEMLAAFTPAGEAVLECPGCRHVVMLAVVADATFSPAELRALGKAREYVASGLRVVWSDGAALVPSATRPGRLVHRVVDGRCDCEAAQYGRHCWHVEAARLARPKEQAA